MYNGTKAVNQLFVLQFVSHLTFMLKDLCSRSELLGITPGKGQSPITADWRCSKVNTADLRWSKSNYRCFADKWGQSSFTADLRCSKVNALAESLQKNRVRGYLPPICGQVVTANWRTDRQLAVLPTMFGNAANWRYCRKSSVAYGYINRNFLREGILWD